MVLAVSGLPCTVKGGGVKGGAKEGVVEEVVEEVGKGVVGSGRAGYRRGQEEEEKGQGVEKEEKMMEGRKEGHQLPILVTPTTA